MLGNSVSFIIVILGFVFFAFPTLASPHPDARSDECFVLVGSIKPRIGLNESHFVRPKGVRFTNADRNAFKVIIEAESPAFPERVLESVSPERLKKLLLENPEAQKAWNRLLELDETIYQFRAYQLTIGRGAKPFLYFRAWSKLPDGDGGHRLAGFVLSVDPKTQMWRIRATISNTP